MGRLLTARRSVLPNLHIAHGPRRTVRRRGRSRATRALGVEDHVVRVIRRPREDIRLQEPNSSIAADPHSGLSVHLGSRVECGNARCVLEKLSCPCACRSRSPERSPLPRTARAPRPARGHCLRASRQAAVRSRRTRPRGVASTRSARRATPGRNPSKKIPIGRSQETRSRTPAIKRLPLFIQVDGF
jgi:hypothetical protein